MADARHMLVCLPPAGASSAYFLGWSERAGEGLDIRTPELPGRLGRFGEPPLRRIADMAEWVFAELEREGMPDVLSVFGHSMGALVGYELTCLLERRGGPLPVALHVSAHAPPHVTRPGLVPGASDQAVIRHFSGLNGRPADAGMIELMLPTIRADLEACAGYAPGTAGRLVTPIVAHSGRFDAAAPAAAMAGWRAYTQGGFAACRHAGDHHYPLAAGPCGILAEVTRRAVAVPAAASVPGTWGE
jgi:surfactin synthase thioesterase subunit